MTELALPAANDIPDPWAPGNLLPLGTLAAELGCTVDKLATRLDGEIVLDDVGMRCVTRATAGALIADRNAKAAAARERAARARAEAKPNQTQERVKALQRAHDRLGAGLLRDPADTR